MSSIIPMGSLFDWECHVVQGNGEVAGPTLECPMGQAEVKLHLHPELPLSFPHASTPTGWMTFGFHVNLNEATMIVLEGMLDLMEEQCELERKGALA